MLLTPRGARAGGRSPRVRGRFAAGPGYSYSHVRHGARTLLATRAGVLTPLQELLFGPPAAPRAPQR